MHMQINFEGFNSWLSNKSTKRARRGSQNGILTGTYHQRPLSRNQVLQQTPGKQASLGPNIIPESILNRIQRKLYNFSAQRNPSKQKSITKKYFEDCARKIMMAQSPNQGKMKESRKSIDSKGLINKSKKGNTRLLTEVFQKYQSAKKSKIDEINLFKEDLKDQKVIGSMICSKYKNKERIKVELRRKPELHQPRSQVKEKRNLSVQLKSSYDCTPWATDKEYFETDFEWDNLISVI